MSKPISKKQKLDEEGREEIDAFEEFSLGELDLKH